MRRVLCLCDAVQEAASLWRTYAANVGCGRLAVTSSLHHVPRSDLSASMRVLSAWSLARVGQHRAAYDAFSDILQVTAAGAYRSAQSTMVAVECLLGRAALALSTARSCSTSVMCLPAALPDLLRALSLCTTSDTRALRLVRTLPCDKRLMPSRLLASVFFLVLPFSFSPSLPVSLRRCLSLYVSGSASSSLAVCVMLPWRGVVLQDAEVLLAQLLLCVNQPQQALNNLQRCLPRVLEHAAAPTRAFACLLLGKCEVRLAEGDAAQSRPRLLSAAKWLTRSAADWTSLCMLTCLREAVYLKVCHAR